MFIFCVQSTFWLAIGLQKYMDVLMAEQQVLGAAITNYQRWIFTFSHGGKNNDKVMTLGWKAE